MEGRVTKMLLGFLQCAADSLLFRYVIIKLFHVAFSLFCTLAFGLSAGTFSFGAFALRLLRLRRCRPNFFKISEIGEVENRNHQSGHENRKNADGSDVARDKVCRTRASKVGNRRPKIVPTPHLPKRLVVLE